MSFIKRYLIAGLLVWLPLGVTIAALIFLVNLFDQSLLLLPEAFRPDVLLGIHIPGFGVILSFFLIFLTGMLVANFLDAICMAFGKKSYREFHWFVLFIQPSSRSQKHCLAMAHRPFRKPICYSIHEKGCGPWRFRPVKPKVKHS